MRVHKSRTLFTFNTWVHCSSMTKNQRSAVPFQGLKTVRELETLYSHGHDKFGYDTGFVDL